MPHSTALNRRQLLARAGTSALGLSFASHAFGESRADASPVSFFLIGDTHFLADKSKATALDEKSAATTAGLIDTLNRLPGTEIPAAAGGGKVAVRGVIHAGDVIDSGDKQGADFPERHATEWRAFTEGFGLSGGDGKLRLPVYEVHGNHDSPHGEGLAIRRIIERNKSRPGVSNVSENGLHYSWDWGPVHFVNLGIVVGGDPRISRKRRYNPLDSLQFLVNDLKARVGESRRPIVVTHHIDVARYSVPCDRDAPPDSKEWDSCDVHAYYAVLKKYNVAAILYGHTHTRNIYRWNGTPKPGTVGLPVFNVDNSSHFAGVEQAFFYFEIGAEELVVREFATKDRWQTGQWTPQTWRVRFAASGS